MPSESPNPTDHADPPPPVLVVASPPAPPPPPDVPATTAIVPTTGLVRQLPDLPEEELSCVAETLALDPRQYHTRQQLIAAIHHRRQTIAAIHIDALTELFVWSGRRVPPGATKEWMAVEVAAIRSMRFRGLSQRGLAALAALRGIDVRGNESVPDLVHRLKKQEGFFARLSRKRRALLGSIVSNLVGESEPAQQLPEDPPPAPGDRSPAQDSPRPAPSAPASSIKHDIEDAGLLGGLAGRIRKSADTYVNQKLDEIEARIDRKLDEIDRRLSDWRDKEIANRLRILKITIWASVVVAAVSLVYVYIQAYWHPPEPPSSRQVTH